MAALPPFTPPAVTHGQAAGQAAPRAVRFRHPAYPSVAPDLLVLMAADSGGGLDYDIALASCCIVADTRWDGGYLAQRAQAGDPALTRAGRPEDGLLRGREYFYCIEGQEPLSFKYPVIPSFHHWRFPHGNLDADGVPRGDLPPPWSDLQLPASSAPPRPTLKGPAAAADRDVTCRVSGYMDAIENAHLVPVSERFWFVSNRMDKYCRRPFEVSAVNDDRNILVLRKDIHHLFDARRFTFVPKRFGPSPGPPEIVTHVLLPSGSPELVGLYHNRAPQPICGISVEFLFARFAWSLFTDEHIPFFGSDLNYAVRLLDKAKGETETQSLGGPDVKNRAQLFASAPSQSRSVSPKKRSHSAYGDEAEDVTDNEYDDDDDDDDGGDEPPRGRPRKRRWQTFGADGAQVPSLSHSFASVTLPSRAGSPGGGDSQPHTPEAPTAGETPGHLRSPKRTYSRPPDTSLLWGG